MNRIVAAAWGAAALFLAYRAVADAMAPKGDATGWLWVAVQAVMSGYGFWQMLQELKASGTKREDAVAGETPSTRPDTSSAASNAPGAWRGPSIPLETQIENLEAAGLVLAPGRSIKELLTSWSRQDYETDPYNLILFAYGSEVESEPWGRAFCERGWNFDMECLEQAGDYVRAFIQLVRITGRPQLVTALSDDFDINAATCAIRYKLNGQDRKLEAQVNSDWADPEAVIAFVRDIEAAIGDGRRYWAADNGQASILFFLTDAEAAAVNSLRAGILKRYAGG